MDEVSAGGLTALIARSADFYGPGIENTSLLTELVLKPMSEGKKANWLISADYKHSFTYTPGAGKATTLLGNTDDAFNQIWHLPTASNPPSGKEWIEMVASEMGVKPNYRTAPRFFVQIMGWFSPVMKEIAEMLYQNDRDYIFDSKKFENRFKFKPTPYDEGIREIVKHDYASAKAS
jgi:nucleoside-diphosphate-sugar epimerase